MSKVKSQKSGFTLIELMVAMAIIGILVVTAMVNFGQNADRDVRQEKDRLTSFLHEVQNKALTGDREGITLGATEKKLCGYGVRMTSPKVFQPFYVAVNSLDTVCSSYIDGGTWTSNTTNFGSPFSFNNNVTVSGEITTSNKIFFLAPEGTTYLDNSSTSGFPITINLTSGSTVSVPVYIEQSGNIH